jgi:hypothetical protein
MNAFRRTLRLGFLAFPGGLVAADVDFAFFESKIRPALVAHCYECHSGDQAKGGLRLDYRGGWEKGGESGPAIVPGSEGESLLIRAIRHEDSKLQMPKGGKILSREVIESFEIWVAQGARDPRDKPPSADDAAAEAWKAQLAERSRWWSLQPPKDFIPPSVLNPDWAREPVDRFILAKLEASGLRPAKPAQAETLLRRLSFVLTGLPPEVDRVGEFREAFAKYPDAAMVALVDELLASPHYGERLARHWMDVVRYTDTYGYEWDIQAKGSHEYRDYLIRAFNADIGLDQLIHEQIAGDLLPHPRINEAAGVNESLIGPMFYHLGEHRHGSSLAFAGIHQEMIDNKVDAFSKTFLAMTVACARCHDHKLDAISQADYYALAGVFMTPRWTTRSIDAPGKNAAAITELKSLRESVRDELAEVWSKGGGLSQEKLKQWAIENHTSIAGAKIEDVAYPMRQLLNSTAWSRVKDLAATATATATELTVEADGDAILAGGPVSQKDSYTVRFTTEPGSSSLMRLEALTHDSLGNRGPGRVAHGNFVLSHIRVEVKPIPAAGAKEAKVRNVALKSASADYSQPNYPVTAALNPKSEGWAVGLGGNVDRTARFMFAEPVELPHGGEWKVTLDFNYGAEHVLGRFRLTPGMENVGGQLGSDESVAENWAKLVKEWRTTREGRRKANERFSELTDFSQPGFPKGWVTDGEGLQHGWVKDCAPRVSLSGETLITEFLPEGYHTHALSSKLPGALRLPAPERFSLARVSLKLAGGEWAGRRAIPQNAFLNEGPLFFDPSLPPTWTAIGVTGLTNGVTRVLTEISTASLNANFPPRTGVARAGKTVLPSNDEGFDKRSWFSVTGLVAHDGGGAPTDALDVFASLYEGEPPATGELAWLRLSDWLAGAVGRWGEGKTTAGDVEALNWLLEEKLLPNDLKSVPRAAPWVKRYREVEAQIDFPRGANSMDERGVAPVNYRLNVRGDVRDEGPAIRRDFLEVFRGMHEVGAASGSGRLELARHLGSRDNPQTARVYVNRVWQWVFGGGIVSTPSDFGKLGGRPSHSELLDWLAIRFMEEGWSTRQLVRRLALSQTFRQSGEADPAGAQQDPANRLLHHYPTRRLEAEAIRDSLLAVSGRLDTRLYGRPINPARSAEDAKKRLFSGPLDGEGRRSLYLEMSIMQPPEFLVGFNLPDLKLPTGKRDETNVPAQALTMLNDPFVNAMAAYWADRLIETRCSDAGDRIGDMFVSALGREPSDAELTRWKTAVREFADDGNDLMTDREAWTAIAHALFNTKEFLYYR